MRTALIFGAEIPTRAARRVAACAGVQVERCAEPSRFVDRVAAARPQLVLFHLDAEGDEPLDLLRGAAAANPEGHLIVLAQPSPPTQMRALLAEPWFTHLVGLDSPWFMDELGAVLAKLTGRGLFGLECYLPWSARVVERSIEDSRAKERVFDDLERFMGAIGVRGRLVRHLHRVADEMLMNAVYDAPVDRRTRRFKYADRARNSRVALDADERPTLRYGSDGRLFGISISDPFGGLSHELLKRYVAKGLRRGDDQIDDKEGGAGLGLYFLYDSLNSLTLNLVPGSRTEVVGLLDIRGSYRDLLACPKSFNVFVQPAR